MRPEAAYEELMRRFREVALLSSCAAVLSWDEQTYMPSGGAEHRGQQLALLAGLQHDKATQPILGDLLSEVERSYLVADPLSPPAVNTRVWRRQYERHIRLPRSLVEELARLVPVAQQAWLTARRLADYSILEPWFARVLELKRQEAAALARGGNLYDGLLEEYEPGASSQELIDLFDVIRQELVPLVASVVYGPRRPTTAVLRHEYPIDRQRLFAEEVVAALGFDFQRGRLDTTAHPFFSHIGPGDCRLTTRFTASNFSDSFFGVLHEVGHGLYEQGLDDSHWGTPMGESVSMGMHEAQARLWEVEVGHCRSFWEHFLPRARYLFPEALQYSTVDEIHEAINNVEPSAIRVGADEATYNLHILVRFELEMAMIAGQLSAADLPACWNEKYRHYLGITPASDAEGCLQDIHWSEGLIGYFPTYTLGNLYAAQMMAHARTVMPELDRSFAEGNFQMLLGWLREHVYAHGHRFAAPRLIEHVTGAPPSAQPFLGGLRGKYRQLGWIKD